MKKIIFGILVLLLASCWNKQAEVMGYAPIYGDTLQMKTISVTTAQPYEGGGKIFVKGNTLFQVENGKGIHVTDISNPSSPQKTAFIKVAGCQEVTVKNDMIYANNLNDLVIIDYTPNRVSLVKRLPATFKNLYNSSRPPERGRFQCPDKTKGIVIGWEKKLLTGANCSY